MKFRKLEMCGTPMCGYAERYFCVRCRHYDTRCLCGSHNSWRCACPDDRGFAGIGERDVVLAMLAKEATQ